MRIFISMPMHGKSDEEIIKAKEEAIKEIKNYFEYFEKNNQLEIICTFDRQDGENLPEKAPRLWWLGRAIQLLANCDGICMCKGWEYAKGCRVEKFVAEQYGIKIYYHQ